MADKLRLGIVGSGAIAGLRHIPAFMKLKDKVTIQALCDKNGSLARDVANKYHIPEAYSELSEMLERESLDIIDICTPPQTHAPLALEVIENNCHVILEKPMALKASDCDKIVEASLEHGVKLCVVHNQLFYPPVIEARKLVAGGSIGNFIGMRIFLSDPSVEMVMREDYWIHKLPGGLIGETGPHVVYKSLPFIGKVESVDVQARSLLKHPWAPFDEFRIELEGEKGYSSIIISYASNRRASTMDLFGSEGMLHLDLLSMLLIRQGKNAVMTPVALARNALGTASQMMRGVAGNALRVLTGKGEFYGHNTIIKEFVDSILNNNEPPITGEEGRETTRVLEMIVAKLDEKYGIPA